MHYHSTLIEIHNLEKWMNLRMNGLLETLATNHYQAMNEWITRIYE